MGDTTVKKIDSATSPKGKDGQKYLASGKGLSMRLWEEEPAKDKEMKKTIRDYETVGFVVSGKAELHTEGQMVILNKGDSWLVPKGAEHSYKILEAFVAVEATSPPAEVHGRDESEHGNTFESYAKATADPVSLQKHAKTEGAPEAEDDGKNAAKIAEAKAKGEKALAEKEKADGAKPEKCEEEKCEEKNPTKAESKAECEDGTCEVPEQAPENSDKPAEVQAEAKEENKEEVKSENPDAEAQVKEAESKEPKAEAKPDAEKEPVPGEDDKDESPDDEREDKNPDAEAVKKEAEEKAAKAQEFAAQIPREGDEVTSNAEERKPEPAEKLPVSGEDSKEQPRQIPQNQEQKKSA